MTPRSGRVRSVLPLVAWAALGIAGCADPVAAPPKDLEAMRADGANAIGNKGHAHNDAPLAARIIINEATGLARVDVTTGSLSPAAAPVPGSVIEKVRLEFVRGADCEHRFSFDKLDNLGQVTLNLPANACARAGETARITAHVRGLKRTKGVDAIVVEVLVLTGDFSGVPGGEPVPFDVSVLPMRQATAHDPIHDIAVQPTETGVTNTYDATVSNAASGFPATVKCEVRVNEVDVTATTQFWIDGAGNQTSGFGENVSIASGTARICRFALSFATAGTHSVTVTAIVTGGTEGDLANNGTTTPVTATSQAPLTNFLWALMQEDAVDPGLPPSTNPPSLGIISQSVRVHMHWQQDVDTEPGTDSWSFTLRARTNGALFDERIGASIPAPRFTQSELAALGTVCRSLQPTSPSTTWSYLQSSVTICAEHNAANPTRANMRLEYVIFSRRFDGVPLPLSQGLLWGPSFSVFAEISSSTSGPFGGVEQTRALEAPSYSGGARTVRYTGS